MSVGKTLQAPALTSAARATIVVAALAGCANVPSFSLRTPDPIVTGSLAAKEQAEPSPVSGVADMAYAVGISKSPARNRLEELFAIDKRCYSIQARDEVWQDFQSMQPGRLGPTEASAEPPPVANPWTPENRAFFEQHCHDEARARRSSEMRATRL